MSSVHLDANATTTVEIHFLPFNIGERQCSVIFLNEEIGEFLYSIEAKSTLPLPDALPFVKTGHSVRISSAAAAGKKFKKGVFVSKLLLTIDCPNQKPALNQPFFAKHLIFIISHHYVF